MITIETYVDEKGEHRWRFRHENGNIMGRSPDGYTDERDRDQALATIITAFSTGDYETKQVDA